MIQIAGIAMAIIVICIFLREYNRVYSIIVSISGGVLILVLLSDKLSELVNSIYELSSFSQSTVGYIKLMLKILGIVILSQFMSNICRDNGESALASMVEISTKILVISMLMPLFELIINLVLGMLK